MRWTTSTIIITLLIVLAASAPAPMAAQSSEYYIPDTVIGPETFSWTGHYGDWYMSSGYQAPDGAILAGWMVDVTSWTYGTGDVDIRYTGATTAQGLPKSTASNLCYLYSASSPVNGQLTLAQADAKCIELGATGRRGHSVWTTSAVTPGGWRQWGTYTGGITIQFRPILYGIPPVTLDANFTADPTSGDAPLTVDFTDTSVGATSWSWDFDGDGIEDSTDQNPTFTYSAAGTYTATLTASDGSNTDTATETITVTIPTRPNTNIAANVRPFRLTDEDVDHPSVWSGANFYNAADFVDGIDETALAFATNQAMVHAAAAGDVISIGQFGSCLSSNTFVDNECLVIFTESNALNYNGADINRLYKYPIADVYQVTIQSDDDEFFSYLVTNPREYIREGEHVDAGCPIGDAVPIIAEYTDFGGMIYSVLDTVRKAASLIADYDAISDLIETGLQQLNAFFEPFTAGYFTSVQHIQRWQKNNYMVPLSDQLTIYPEDSGALCNYTPSACMNPDEHFTAPESWQTYGEVAFAASGGVTLAPGARIHIELALDGSTAYQLNATTGNAGGAFQAWIGTTEIDGFVASDRFIAIAGQTHSPDMGTFYSAGIANTGTSPLLLTSMCISEAGSGGGGRTCIFENASFEGNPPEWAWNIDVTGSATISSGAAPGYLVIQAGMGDTVTFSQAVTLRNTNADPYDFFGSIEVSHSPVVNLDNYIDISATFGTADVTFINDVMPYPVSGSDWVDHTFTMDVALDGGETVDDTFSIIFTFTGSELITFYMHEICIGDPFGAPGGNPFTPSCTIVSPPEPEAIVGDWILWHWQRLQQFFDCDLMVLLNAMNRAMVDFFTTVTWSIRWSQSSVMMYSDWLTTDLIHWLDGHFRNMAVGQVTTIENSGGASIWDVLLAFVNGLVDAVLKILDFLDWLIRQVVDLIGAVVYGLIDLVLLVIAQALQLLLLARDILEAILFAFNNATPTPIPGMPMCATDPRSSGWCISIWVLDNTIWSGPGDVIIPLIVSILSIHLLLWVVGELKRSVVEMGVTS